VSVSAPGAGNAVLYAVSYGVCECSRALYCDYDENKITPFDAAKFDSVNEFRARPIMDSDKPSTQFAAIAIVGLPCLWI